MAPRGAAGLPEGLQTVMEAMSGFSLAGVVVHRNSAEPARLGAAAFAKGDHIHVAPGQERHLPHEAWHVVQQKQGRVSPTLQMKSGVPVNDDTGLEREADVMGARATQMMQAGRAPGEHRPPPELGPCTGPVQLKITMGDGTIHEGADKVQAVIAKIKEVAPHLWNNALGGTLAGMLVRGDNGPYATYLELAQALAARQRGLDAAEKGKGREVRVAQSSGGEIADSGKYGGDKVVKLKGSDRHVKLDNEGPSFYAITGGPAKAHNLQKFAQICRDLKVISEQDGKQPRVYCSADTPASVIDVAIDILGHNNIYEVESGKHWMINPYAMDMPGYGKTPVINPGTGLPQGAMPYIN
jgi:hypothetical protein